MTSINEIPAGFELDRLIAEKVMGWANYHFHYDDKSDEYVMSDKFDEDAERFFSTLPFPRFIRSGYSQDMAIYVWREGEGEPDQEEDNPWSPSTNIAHAWEVVEKIEAPLRIHKMLILKNIKTAYINSKNTGRGLAKWHAAVGASIYASRNYFYKCSFGSLENVSFISYADTAPLAICRAALAAIGFIHE